MLTCVSMYSSVSGRCLEDSFFWERLFHIILALLDFMNKLITNSVLVFSGNKVRANHDQPVQQVQGMTMLNCDKSYPNTNCFILD